MSRTPGKAPSTTKDATTASSRGQHDSHVVPPPVGPSVPFMTTFVIHGSVAIADVDDLGAEVVAVRAARSLTCA